MHQTWLRPLLSFVFTSLSLIHHQPFDAIPPFHSRQSCNSLRELRPHVRFLPSLCPRHSTSSLDVSKQAAWYYTPVFSKYIHSLKLEVPKGTRRFVMFVG
ncbi:uncharacterized protein F5147DRAFT_701838 [Suillus discolor]|uniref:Secreted protein n=1 Tax=Suillus discolor TaxID=1912936 RepID=A0A9P7JSP6_9AGAM|nr:uncharacterized protein F5147DRAFT_701838 [Suillus discolor]KAG2105770.1 hypothetical protein F5147DRAFT_701838 [Suillus discolor]